ncbi:sensor histidine kinase [Sphaerisporangium fuscum]|uniref:sensor histidine kinase n=1 Tax=Sphaerisporangium fuscum TaxID=2835868 RepID=UPI001BDC9ACB|nr:sensor histidine kinase [Sphaerisporangium fuscum]
MFGRLRAWGARHGRLVDAAWLAPLILVCLLSAGDYAGRLDRAYGIGAIGYLAISAVLVTPLLWRRRRPVHVFAVVAFLSFVQWLAAVEPLPANLAVLVALYAVASTCPLGWAVAATAIAELGGFLALSRWGNLVPSPIVAISLLMLVIWLAGVYAKTRRRYLESLEERAERAERERDQQARIATAAERARIARELHDVVAHNVSVMIVQADGAAYAIDGDPELARRAVQTISRTGRQALAEMRRLVGMLRQDDARDDDYAPQPGVDDLDELVAQTRRSGLPVDFTVNGTRRDLPEGEQLAIYRIVQEALTNALKHGGPGARARVEMDYGPREIMLRVTDDGRGAAAPRGIDGHGLIGMRERAAMYGGSVQASPCPGGGFEVAVRLPVSRAA